MSSFVELKNVYKRYKMGEVTITASNGVSFTIEKGEFAVIVGSSGAGKTTILNILGGMDSCDEGEVIVDGKDVAKLSPKELIEYRRYDIGFVFQFYNLVQNLTAKENIELATQITKDAYDPIEVLKEVGLEDRINNFPSQLSGGEQQRVSIARALAKKPKLLLCDEPTGALDTASGLQVMELFKQLNQEGMTVIMITHDPDIAAHAHRVMTIRDGILSSAEEEEFYYEEE